eukprot:gene1112-1666_t
MIMKQIPVVVIHLEDKAYITNFVKLNTKHNLLYFIGDETTEHYETSFHNVIHINKKILQTGKNMEIINQYQDPNPKITKHESYLIYLSYLRWFYLQTFMKMYDFDKIFHIDSDCILTLNVNDFKFTKDNAFNFRKRMKVYKDTGFYVNQDKRYKDEKKLTGYQFVE